MKQVDKQAKERYLDRLRLIRDGAAANPFESEQQKEAIRQRAKKEVKFFVEYFLSHYATCECADFQIKLANRVTKNPTCRELVRWPRGHAKSVWCDLIIPLWLWIRGESLYMILVGNTYEKAVELLSDIQAEFEANPRILHYFGEQQLRGSWEDGNFSTRDGRLHGRAVGMRQSVRGLRKKAQRPNYCSCDDLEDQQTQKNPKRQDAIIQWIENDLLKTMDGPLRRYLHPTTPTNGASRTSWSAGIRIGTSTRCSPTTANTPRYGRRSTPRSISGSRRPTASSRRGPSFCTRR